MKKIILYILLALTIDTIAQVQKLPADTEFFYTYGGVNNDEARDIVEAYDKGYLLVGTTSSFGQGNTSFYIIKTDSLGNHQWSSVQGGSQNDWAYTVQRTHDSCYMVAGYSNSFVTSSLNNYSAYYLKIDRSGNLIWQKSIDKGSWSFVYGSCALPDSGFVLCGQTYTTAQGDADGYLIRIDKNGDTLWTKHYGGNQDEVFNSVSIMNNRLYAVGSNNSHPTDGNSDGWLVKLDLSGNQLQENFISYGDSIQETLNGITPYNDSLFTVCGAAIHLDSNSTSPMVEKIDTNLLVKSICIDGAIKQHQGTHVNLNKVLNTSYGNLCVIGTKIGAGIGGSGMFFLGLDMNGYYINDYSPTEGGTLDDYGYSGIYTYSGKIIGIGSTFSYGAGGDDMFLIRFNRDSILNAPIHTFIGTNYTDTLFYWQVSIKKHEENTNVKLFPNPAINEINLHVENKQIQNYTAKIFSILGEELSQHNVNSNTNTKIDISKLPSGCYFLSIEQNNKSISILHFVIAQ